MVFDVCVITAERKVYDQFARPIKSFQISVKKENRFKHMRGLIMF